MKLKNLSWIILLSIWSFSCSQQQTQIELPITVKKGVGPFHVGYRSTSSIEKDEKNPWVKTYLNVTGIPDGWTDIKQIEIPTNMYQYIYQNYLSGNLTNNFYESLKQGQNWTPDTLNLSKTPLKCQIAVAFGKDATGKIKMVVDTNNNLDFSDDSIFTPLEISLNSKTNWDSLIAQNAIMVAYERLSENKIIQEKALLFIDHIPNSDIIMFNFPQYAITQLDGKDISVCSDYFVDLSFDRTSLILSDPLSNKVHAEDNNLFNNDEYITVNGITYKNKGVNLNKNVLVLEKITIPRESLNSSQEGFKAFPFERTDFKTKNKISLANYKGKYLLIDFWAEWCGPCVQELPHLKILYDKVDKSKIEFLGIVCHSHAEKLDELMQQYAITWPQILTDQSDNIEKIYEIVAYPTTFLIDPVGIIIERGIRGEDLEKKINELLKK